MTTTPSLIGSSDMSMRQMVQLSGLSEHALRFYEKVGLVGPIARDASSGHRHYDEGDAIQIVTIACLRATGMSIDEMRRYFELNEIGLPAAAEQIELFEQHKASVRQQITRLEHQLEYLDGKVAYWRALERGDQVQAKAIGTRNLEKALEINNEIKQENA
ncbi:MerR family transcriptional regulator [Isoptericola aurantiacus]|uniref:MerR family transcriptional regulator n=1 Tax=Isoptericola aurantiacus TaxID=3377839 RepID=UPI00383B482A